MLFREQYDLPPRDPLWSAFVLLLLLVPILLLFVYFGLADHAFRLLGLSSDGASVLLAASLLGSVVNIPLTRRRIVLADAESYPLPAPWHWLAPILHYYPPKVTVQVIALNVGGAIVPIVFSTYLLVRLSPSIPAVLGATLSVTIVARVLARPQPGVGVTLPVMVSPLVAALASRGFVHLVGAPIAVAAPVAYIAGTLGTLIGADVLLLPAILHGRLLPAGGVSGTSSTFVSSIGGAGVFDGIFLTGILAPFLATF